MFYSSHFPFILAFLFTTDSCNIILHKLENKRNFQHEEHHICAITINIITEWMNCNVQLEQRNILVELLNEYLLGEQNFEELVTIRSMYTYAVGISAVV